MTVTRTVASPFQTPPTPQRLFLWFPLEQSREKLLPWLAESGDRHEAPEDGRCLVVYLDRLDVERLFAGLSGRLSFEEARDTKALLFEGPGEPAMGDFARVVSLKDVFIRRRADWLVDLLAENRITSHFQPIVQAHDTSVIFAQEALLRGFDRDGLPIAPNAIFGCAQEANLLHEVDRAARESAIRQIHAQGLASQVFINFNPSALYDPALCLASTLRLIDELAISRGRIVFEVVESHHVTETDHLKRILDFCRAEGFRIALDDMGSGYSTLNLVHQLRPDFIKLDMAMIRDVHQDTYKSLVTQKLLELAQGLGIETIAEGIEHAGELEWLRAHGATYVQGFLIARPCSPPLRETPAIPHAGVSKDPLESVVLASAVHSVA